MGVCRVAGGGRATAPVNYKANFADNTWEQIIDACQKNKVPDTWLVADQKTMTINGTDYLIDIIGKNHDIYSDGSGTAPLTFQLHDCYWTLYEMNSSNTNSGGWSSCKMRNTHLPTILALMPSDVQAGIKEVNKLTSAGTQSSTINTTEDKLFLLSEIEIYGTVYSSKSGEGTQYEYYSAGNSRVKYPNGISGVSNSWWERSPFATANTAFCVVSNSGNTSTNGATSERPTVTCGVSFAFCF